MNKHLLALMLTCWASQAMAAFDVVALGVNGGVEEGNLTSYLVRSDDQKLYLGLDAGSVMPAYHDIDNEPSHASKHLLTKVLREDWGFDGLVVADYIGVSLLYQHHGLASNKAEAAALSFNAGLDQELPGEDCATHLREALDRGLITPEKIDEIVARVLTEKFRLGIFE